MEYQQIPAPKKSTQFSLSPEEINEVFLKATKEAGYNIDLSGVQFSFSRETYRRDPFRYEPHFRFKGWIGFSLRHVWYFNPQEAASIIRDYLISCGKNIPDGDVTIFAFEPLVANGKVVYCVS